MKRLFALILSITLLFSGCGNKGFGQSAAVATDPPTDPTINDTPPALQLPEQLTCSDFELTLALEQLDFSLLAAAFLNDINHNPEYSDESYIKDYVYVGDADNNGHLEMVYTNAILMFENNDGGRRSVFLNNLAGSTNDIFISDSAVIYRETSKEPIFVEHGNHEHRLNQYQYYEWDGGWKFAFTMAVQASDEECDADLSRGFIDGREVNWAEIQRHKNSLDLTQINGKLCQYINSSFDAAYLDYLLEQLDAYFTASYDDYCGRFACDIDSDGYVEQIFVLKKFVTSWLSGIEDIYNMPKEAMYSATMINPADDRTGFLIADYDGERLHISSACASEHVAVTEDSTIIRSGNKLVVDGKKLVIHGWEETAETAELPTFTLEIAGEVLGVYNNYCTFGVCDLGNDFIDESFKRQILRSLGWSDDAMMSYDLIEVPCCDTVEESITHVEQYVDKKMIPDRTDYADQPVEYNGRLFALIAGKGYESYAISGEPILIDKNHAMIELVPGIPEYFGPNDVAYFAWIDGHWKLTDIKQGVAVKDYSNIFAIIAPQLEIDGYTNIVIKHADLGGGQNDELLCLCQRDGVWYLIIYIIVDGAPVPKHNIPLSDKACYLTEYNGDTYLLTYIQNIVEDGSGTYHSYSYTLSGFDSDGNESIAEQGSTGYYDSTANAQQAAAFFEKLNKYLVKIIVLYDPYKLTGKTFMEQSDASFGQVPPEPEQEQDEKPEEMQMGFVQINDPDSWLNLREGPGLSYECVRLDPNDPGSIVRQALGSPVTVMEEVESADGTWLKVRITYQDRIIEGYSYKAYIRLVNE